MSATLEELEARVAALEAERADYRAVLSAINALGANQREHSDRVHAVEDGLSGVEQALSEVQRTVTDSIGQIRSIDEHLAEVKDLIVRALDR
ncbi:hypothetical protein OG921_00795 [Aldersonia sp. NBC_00410]|uniref:hypothetical protein n=1 Tax=Aldersonia sp. NBC_00410 TaxID=2975954 RepID=UPI00224E4A47|nr:hypothetical protein [Aldersonia sp. NBC_00410]MCX5041727.1 hypothetical protein [Aldersonia sp. NBC_00410]